MSAMLKGNAAALVSAFPGAAVQEPPTAELPRGDAAAMVPVALPLTAPRIITGIAGGKRIGWPVIEGVMLEGVEARPGAVDVGTGPGLEEALAGHIAADGRAAALVEAVTVMTEGDRVTAIGEQLRLVPGMVGFVASGGEARVVTGAPGIVDDEKRLTNGPGPLRGDDTIAPGVVGIAICVVPIVDICARQLPLTSTNADRALKKLRILFSGTNHRRLITNLPAPAAVSPSLHRQDR